MSNRPPIPAEISRQILIESGHRCAVCGAGCPLERAHIIPWHKSGEHKADNLICLCANCHERADKEKWGASTLKVYKRKPWVMRQYENTDRRPEPSAKIHIEIDMELGRFDDRVQRWLQSGLAGFLEISPSSVQIESIWEGSVTVTIELPADSAEKLLSAYERNEPELARFLEPLVLLGLHMGHSRALIAARRVVEELFSDEACFFDLISKRFFAQIESLQKQQATTHRPRLLERAFPRRPVSAFAMALSELVPEGAAMTPRVLIAAIRMEDILLPHRASLAAGETLPEPIQGEVMDIGREAKLPDEVVGRLIEALLQGSSSSH